MVNLIICLRHSGILNFKNLKPFGISNFTASTVSDAVPHRRLYRKDIFPRKAGFRYAQLAYLPAQLNLHLIFNRGEAYFSGSANLKITQFRLKIPVNFYVKNEINLCNIHADICITFGTSKIGADNFRIESGGGYFYLSSRSMDNAFFQTV